MQTITTLIYAKQILTLANGILEEHALAIDQGKIIAIVPKAEAQQIYQAKHEYYLSKHLVMPGLVNAHTHTSMNLLRGLADDLSLHPWLQNHIWPAEAAVISPEFVLDGLEHAMAELIRGGVTCFLDDYFYVDQRAEMVDAVGMRAALSEPLFKFSTPWSPSFEKTFERTERLIEFCKNSKTVYPALFPHAPYSTDLNILKKASAFVQQHDLIIHSHLLESGSEIEESIREYGKRPIALWDELGLIGPKTIAVHMTYVNDEDLSIIMNRKASVVNCPESNMKLASRVCPVQQMLHMGINVALGTDGAASNNDLDMFGEMKSAAFLSKVTSDNPENLNAKTVVEMATINGAKALHLDQEIGSIEVGKAADIIAIDMDTIETQPCYSPMSQIVYATPRSQVTHVWVNGKVLMDNRNLTTLDEAAILAKTKVWREKLKPYALQV